MSTNQLMKRFDKVCKDAENFNAKNRAKRLLPMTNGQHNHVTEIGIYDSKRKKYAVTDIRAHNAAEIMTDIEALVDFAFKG